MLLPVQACVVVRTLLTVLSMILSIFLLACSVPAPTPDIPATVTAQVEAQLSAVPTTVPLPATATLEPTPQPMPEPTATPSAVPIANTAVVEVATPTATPTTIPVPTAMSQPTHTPLPVPTAIPTPTPDPRVVLLEQEAIAWGNAVSNHDWEAVFAISNVDFQRKCPVEEFIPFITLVNAYDPLGIPKGSNYVLDDIRIEEDLAWVYSHFEAQGGPIYHDTDEYATDEPPEQIWVDGRWQQYWPPPGSEQDPSFERPCDLENFRGFVIEVPARAGSTLIYENGAHIRVTNIVNNAWPLIQRNYEYSDPPVQGSRYYMVNVEVTYPSGVGAIAADTYHFALVGADRVTYDAYENSCGWNIPDSLSGEIYAGGSIRGNICFEVNAREQGFILIYSPGYDGYPLFLSLD